MEVTCPRCNQVLPRHSVDASADTVQCPTCHEEFSLKQAIKGKSSIKPRKQMSTSPPQGAIVTIQKEGQSIRLTLPRQKFQLSKLPIVIFGIFWLGFVGVWTFLAIWGGAGAMAIFSVPFWFFGASFFGQALMPSFSREEIIITNTGLEVVIHKPWRTKRAQFEYKENLRVERKRTNVKVKSKSSFGRRRVEEPRILLLSTSSSRSMKFFRHAPAKDQIWTRDFLSGYLETARLG